VPGVLDRVVYGVKVPGPDGRAGMGALVVTLAFDLADLYCDVRDQLPAYARPVLVRLLTTLEATRRNQRRTHSFISGS
jgi:fatty-acyl-CoA synthase